MRGGALWQRLIARIKKVRWPPYWTGMRSISNTGVARAVILIPIIGYWIILNDHLLEISAFSRKLFGKPTETPQPASWRLFATYFGLCFVALASFVYQWRCREEVKKYASPTEYIAAVLPHISDIEEQRIVAALSDGDDGSRAALEEIRERFRTSNPQIKSDEDLRRHWQHAFLRNLLQAHFDLCNRQPKWARFVAGGAYLIGGLILLIPSADIFVAVSCALLRAMHFSGDFCRWWTGCC